MGAVPYKYTDEQVAGDWDLYRSLATEYVQNYDGTFNLLLQYRMRVRWGHDLTVPMVRATLNCMLHDAQVVNLPPPEGPSNIVQFRRQGASFRDYVGRVRLAPDARPVDFDDYEDEVVEVERPKFVEMPITWHHDYGMTEHKQARVVHRIHPDSYARWDTEKQTGTPIIWWRCKGYRGAHQMGKSRILIMDSLEAAIHIMQSRGEIYLCLRCRELANGQQVLVDEVLSLVDRGQVGTSDLHTLSTWRSSARHRPWGMPDDGVRLQD